MHIPHDRLYDFHRLRTKAHVDCMNYFARLLGYHFPEHDNDKLSDTICTGYVYHNYQKYHPDFQITPAHQELFEFARAEHHRTQPHHLEYYDDVRSISDMTLIEMVCDWHSASFEQRFITHEDPYDYIVRDFYYIYLHNTYNFSEHQTDLILQLCDFLDTYTDHNAVMKIWTPLLSF